MSKRCSFCGFRIRGREHHSGFHHHHRERRLGVLGYDSVVGGKLVKRTKVRT